MPPASPADSTESGVPRTRRFHNKSRTGCRGCKEKRIKCDEGRPVCSNCIRRSTPCEFKQSEDETPETLALSSVGSSSKSSIGRLRRSRRRDVSSVPSKFTFVDVSKPVTRKRKRKSFEHITITPNEPDKVDHANSPAAASEAEVVVGPLPSLVTAVDQALERGQKLAQIMIVSKESPLLRSENEYIPTPTKSPSRGSGNALFNSIALGGFMSHVPHLEHAPIQVSPADSPTGSISLWQSSPSTALRQSGTGVKISLQDYNLIHTYRTFTCQTFPYVTPDRNPWKALTFDLQFRNPYLYHVTIAITAAHLRYLQGVATPSLLEVSHYVKSLTSYRECLAANPVVSLMVSKSGDIPVESQGLFATSALLGAYMWATEMTDIHSWLIAKFSMTVGTREIVHGIWDAKMFTEFREAVGDSLQDVREKLYDTVQLGIGSGVRLPALEALATGQATSQLLLQGAADESEDIDAPADNDEGASGALGPEIYDTRYGWMDWEECPFYKTSNGAMVADIGSLHRLVCIITTLESPNRISTECMTALVRLMFMWPGLSCYVILEKLKTKDKRVYLLLAYYYAAVVKMNQLSTPSLEEILDDSKVNKPPEEALRSWWLAKNPRLLLRGIVDWLGKDWIQWLEWPLKILREEEDSERRRIEGLWEPAMEGMNFPI